jgi:hypothetical protein
MKGDISTMLYKPYKLGEALRYAFLLWITGSVWGTIVFMVPALRNVPSFPYISKLPAISIPLLIVFPITMFFLSKIYLRETDRKAREGLKFGVTILFMNLILDIVVFVIPFEIHDYFNYFSIWFGYTMFIVIPWLTGKWLQRKAIPS